MTKANRIRINCIFLIICDLIGSLVLLLCPMGAYVLYPANHDRENTAARKLTRDWSHEAEAHA